MILLLRVTLPLLLQTHDFFDLPVDRKTACRIPAKQRIAHKISERTSQNKVAQSR
jgi:hypothetical protein